MTDLPKRPRPTDETLYEDMIQAALQFGNVANLINMHGAGLMKDEKQAEDYLTALDNLSGRLLDLCETINAYTEDRRGEINAKRWGVERP